MASGLDVGGAELQLVQLAVGLRARGWHVHLVSMQRGGRYARELTDAGIPIDVVPTPRVASPLTLIRLIIAIVRQRPDVVQTFAFRANLWARLAAIYVGKPVVISIRATYSYLPSLYYPVERVLSWKTKYVVVPSEATARHLVNTVGLRNSKVVCIPNGVRSDGLISNITRQGAREAFGLPQDAFVVVCPARLVSFKNHRGLIAALEAVPRDGRPSVLVLAGDGPLRAELLARASDSIVDIRLLGEVPRASLGQLLVAADVVALMSEFEGMPNAALEAMVCAAPVVATAVDGTAELVLDGVTGILVERGDIQGMSRALARLRSDRSLCDRMGAAARARALAEYTVDSNTERFISVYERVLSGA